MVESGGGLVIVELTGVVVVVDGVAPVVLDFVAVVASGAVVADGFLHAALSAMEPRGLLCDEITSALDPELKNEVLSVLESLKREGLTLILVTHEMGFARRAADRVVVLADGKIIEDGPPDIVLDDPQMPRTRQFLSQILM